MNLKATLRVIIAIQLLCQNLLLADSHDYHAQVNGTMNSSASLLNAWLREQTPAATNWDIGGQLRVRYEDKENAGFVPNRDFIAHGQDNSNDFLELRTKLHLGWTPASWVNFFVEGRDSRVWFDKRVPTPFEDNFDLHQAFAVLGNAREFPLTLKVGRQEMLYGDERFIGIADSSNSGRVFDAAKLRFENDFCWVDAFAGRVIIPHDKSFNVPNDYDWFSGIYASSKKIIPRQETQLYFLARNVGVKSPNAIENGFGGPTSRDVYTVGARVKSLPGAFNGWDYGAEIAGQFGSINSGGQRFAHEAIAADALLGYTWTNAAGSPRLGVGYSYSSGDSNPNDNKIETFDLLFGPAHRLYGMMDLFGLRNSHNPSASLTIKPAKGLSMKLEYLAFWLADTHDFAYPETGSGRSGNGYGLNPQHDSFLGSELDLLATWQPAKWMEMQFGYGHFFVGDYIRQSVNSFPANGGAVDADWIYLQGKLFF